MSSNGSTLAARCPACSTVFRVVPDQLRVSDGWVRCGRCAEVFNAAEALIDLDSGAPRRMPEPPPPAPRGLAPLQPLKPPPEEAPTFEPSQAPPRADDGFDLALPPSEIVPVPAAPEPEATPADLGFDSTVAPDREPDLAATEPAPDLRAEPEDRQAATPEMPSFVRRADRAARWRRPRVRAALAGVALLAVALLAGQAVGVYRDLVAARFPATAGMLSAACRVFGCSVGPARAIDSLSVESSGLVRVEKSDIYRLSVALRNRAGIELAVPALDLSLTDSQGRLIARRVLRAAELGASSPTLAPGRDLALQATLRAASQATPGAGASDAEVVSGYTIELFYP